jgi:RNA polymerase sigma-70 factor (ECF subfamily)
MGPTRPSNSTVTDRLLYAFAELQQDLIAKLWLVLGNREDARDMAQEAFLKCWRASAGLATVNDLRAWVFRVALNSAKDLQRSAWRRRAKPLGEGGVTIPSRHATPGHALENREMLELLRHAINSLRPEEQEIVLLRQKSELSFEQIARFRRRPIGTVKTQMRSALRKLHRKLA